MREDPELDKMSISMSIYFPQSEAVYAEFVSETTNSTLCTMPTKLPLLLTTAPRVTILTKRLESKVMQNITLKSILKLFYADCVR